MNDTDSKPWNDICFDEDDNGDVIVTAVSFTEHDDRGHAMPGKDSKYTHFKKMPKKDNVSYSDLSDDSDEDVEQYEMLSLKERLLKNIHTKSSDNQLTCNSKPSISPRPQSLGCKIKSYTNTHNSTDSENIILLDDEKSNSTGIQKSGQIQPRKSSPIVIEENSNDCYLESAFDSQLSHVTSHSGSTCLSLDNLSEVSTSTDQGSGIHSLGTKCAEVKTKKKRTPEEIAESKLQAKKRKQDRESAREAKELEKKRQAQIRMAEKERKKQFGSTKDCLQYLKVVFDNHVVNDCGLGAALFKVCDNLGVQCVTKSQRVPFCITWRRTVTELNINSTEVETMKTEKTEEDVVVVIPIADFIQLVNANKQDQLGLSLGSDRTLTSFVQTLQDHLPGKAITLVVMGIEKYFRDQKTHQNRQHKEAVLSGQQLGKATQKQKKSGPVTSVSRIDVEEAVTKTQLLTDTVVQALETSDDVAELIRTYTKAVAEKPAKKDRLQSIFSFHEDGTTGVKVDRAGNGLLKVWKQQLLQFNNISPDIAEAIVSEYPSPRLLQQAYKQCNSQKEAERLLENIVVRRGAGVLETTRRVGKEMSRRFYIFMSGNPNEIIK